MSPHPSPQFPVCRKLKENRILLAFFCRVSADQCLGSGSVGSARFWLPGFGSKEQNINLKLKKKKFYSQTPNLNYYKGEIIKISLFLNGSSSFSIKISYKNKTKNLKILLS